MSFDITTYLYSFIVSNYPIIATIGIVVTILTTFIKFFRYLFQRKNKEPPFGYFQRKKDTTGSWYIFVHSPAKPVLLCNATFKGKKLPLRGGKGYDKNIPYGGGCNWDMPKDVSDNDNGFVIVLDDKKKLIKQKFSKMISEDG